MRLEVPGAPHLTYCTNIHPGETWPEVLANVDRHVRAVKASIVPDRPFGVGLRLSALAAEQLGRPERLEEFCAYLHDHALYVFTVNGFPYGPFHGQPVKEQVYLPDWLDDARLAYADRLAFILSELLPSRGVGEGSVSTVPGAWHSRIASPSDVAAMADRMLRHLATLHRIRERRDKIVTLALEPEPLCHLQAVADTVRFFETHLFASGALARFSQLTGLSRAEAERFLRWHATVCLDAAHFAVAFEEPASTTDAFAAAGIRIGKIQVSAGLIARFAAIEEAAPALSSFADGVYLHQVVERRGDGLVRYPDLPDAIAAAAGSGPAEREWRIHFHVPIFCEQLGPFTNTQPWLRTLLGAVRRRHLAPHLEVETYSWSVLPAEHRHDLAVVGEQDEITSSIARELRWVLQELTA